MIQAITSLSSGIELGLVPLCCCKGKPVPPAQFQLCIELEVMLDMVSECINGF